MVDISIDYNPADQNYKDLLIINNDLVLTADANPAGTNNILQDILQRLQFFLGEWFMDNSQGIPWIQQILVKNPQQGSIDAIFKNVILGTPGVLQLTQYTGTPNPTIRVLNVSFTALTTTGTVSYSGNVSPVVATAQPGG